MNAFDSSVATLSPLEKRSLLANIMRREEATAVTTAPLSHGQKALWFLHQSAPESAAYHVAFSARILTCINIAALQRAVQALIDRHGQLRASFRLRNNEPVQEI